MMRKIIVVVAMLAVSACASVPMSSPELDQAAKEFADAPSDKSHLYIFRDEGFGAAVPMTVMLDGKILGKTGAHTYFFVTLPPGPHSITSEAENTATLQIDTKGGEAYYVWQEVKMGFMFARTALHQVDADRGQRGVMASSRIAEQVSLEQ